VLPDSGSPYEGTEGGSVVDAAEFLLSNFTEMNKLWVRMRHQVRSAGAALCMRRTRAPGGTPGVEDSQG
jgi:hypothetical protein